MLQTIIIADCRQTVPQNFEVDAGFASYQRFLQTTIPKYIAICDGHQWIRRPIGLVVLNDDFNAPKIIGGRFLDVKIAAKALESPTSRVAGSASKITGETWSTFLVVAVKRIDDMLNGSSIAPQLTPTSKGRIVIYSSDILLIGSDFCDANTSSQFEENVMSFCRAVISLRNKFPNILIEIISVAVSQLPSSAQLLTNAYSNTTQSLQVMLKKNLSDTVSFSVMRNSSMHFEEELRRLVAAYAPLVSTKLEFPPVSGECNWS